MCSYGIQWIVVIVTVITMMTVSINGYEMKSLRNRHLQTTQTSNYRATYKADFNHFRDALCYGDPPVLQVSCYGTLMNILNVSDPTIICTQTTTPEITNGTTYQCQNTCTGTLCDGIYGGSNYGSIEFMCEGNDYKQVAAEYTFLGGNDGSCDASSSTTTFNAHIGRLGISCPEETSTSRKYLYDDTFAECTRLGATVVSGDFAAEDDEDDIYVCITGTDCKGMACVVSYTSFTLVTTILSFLDTCVESLVEITMPPVVAPVVGTNQVKSTFEASWAQLYSSITAISLCTNNNPLVTITCGNGASIYYVNSTDPSMSCINSTLSEMACLGDPTLLKDRFTSVIYDCIGPTTPTSQVTYPESAATCSGSTFEITVAHAVTQGVLCDIDGEQFYYYRDLVFECAESRHNFDVVSDDLGFETYRYVCREESTFPLGSSTSQTIRNVTITTDNGWLQNPNGCIFQVNGVTGPTQPVATPTTPPAPNSLQPIKSSVLPTTSPSILPTKSKTNTDIPIVQPNQPTSSTPRDTNPTSVDSSSTNGSILGIAIGCIGGGVAIAAIIGFIVFLRRREPNGGSDVGKPNNTMKHPTESNTDDDYTPYVAAAPPTISTSSPPTATGVSVSRSSQSSQNQHHYHVQPPIVEATNQVTTTTTTPVLIQPQRVSAAYEKVVSPDTRSVRSSNTRASASNYVVDVKDQCRSVVVRATSPTPSSRSSQYNAYEAQQQQQQGDSIIPFAIAVGVSTASVTSSLQSSTKQSSKKEPPGRISADP